MSDETARPTIPHTDLIERVAEGRWSEVWRGQRKRVPVAVKIARGETGARMLRAEEEVTARIAGVVPTAYAAGTFRHYDTAYQFSPGVPAHRLVPGVAAPLAAGDGERPWLVYPWIGDRSLRDALRAVDGENRRATVVAMFGRLLAAMRSVHYAGIAHGDLKPENVLVDERGRPCVVDFGLAREQARERLAQRLDHSLRTESGLLGGTLAYLPPEAVKGAEPSMAGDVYALGVMLHEVLLGRRPDKAIGLDDLRALLPDGVACVLCKALAFDPKDRYPDAGALLHDLDPLLPALTATGAGRIARLTGRLVLATLAAFFVALRYAAVGVLLGTYVVLAAVPLVVLAARPQAEVFGVVVGTVASWVPFVLIHLFIGWRGPETREELAARQKGRVVSTPPPPRDPAP